MKINLEDLNAGQRAAAETINGPLLVLSGAGTGKTRTITYRIANMLAHGISPSEILAVTFTNKAAGEMAERVRAVAGPAAKHMQVSTFHSFGLRVVRENTAFFGLPSAFNIYDTNDQLALIRKGVRQLRVPNKKFRPEKILWEMQKCRDGNPDPQKAVNPKLPDPDENWAIRHVFPYYIEQMRKCGAVDFDDLLFLPLRLFNERPDILEKYRARFRYVLVDEYQDTNATQFEIVKLLTEKSRNLCVVGDDDQSIYGWRGAEIRNILDFEKTFPEAKVVRLEENYRSSQSILDAANCVIKNNSHRKAKRLWTELGAGEKIKTYAALDEESECQLVADLILNRHAEGTPFGDMTILMRMNTQALRFEEALRRNHVPYVLKGTLSFLDRKEMRDFLSYLKLLVNPQDEEALMRIINVPSRKIGATALAKFSDFAGSRNLGLYSALARIAECEEIKPNTREAMAEFYNLIERYRVLVDGKTFSKSVRDLWDELCYEQELASLDMDEREERLGNVSALIDSIKYYESQDPEASLCSFLQNLNLQEEDQEDEDEELDDKAKVKMMTIHSSKGLEFPFVYLVGCEDGILPHERSVAEGQLEEERRLFYVAITRAKKDICITYPLERVRYGVGITCEPSRFLSEIDEELLERHDIGCDEEASPETSAIFLEKLRKIFEEE